MALKDQILKDKSIFLNIDEFASIHDIDGLNYTVVVTSENYVNNAGEYIEDLQFYIDTEDIINPLSFETDRVISFDGNLFKVLNSRDDMGITEVIATAMIGDRMFEVKYRLAVGVGANSDLGIPGTKTDWEDCSSFDINPRYQEITNEFKLENFGIIQQGSVKLMVDKEGLVKSDLESYEYLVNGIEYSLITGQVIEDSMFYNLLLKRLQ